MLSIWMSRSCALTCKDDWRVGDLGNVFQLIGTKSERKCNRVTNLPRLNAVFFSKTHLDYLRGRKDLSTITPRCPSNDRNGGRALCRCRSYFCQNPTNADIAQRIGKKLCISWVFHDHDTGQIVERTIS